MKIEQTGAAGSADCEVSFNALIVHFQIVNFLIINSLITAALMIEALMLVTLSCLRSRTGSSISVVFNLSTAQMLRLFCHWSHISLI